MQRRSVLALGAVALVPATATADHLGAERPIDLYRALMIDTPRPQTAKLLLQAAWDDPRVSYLQWKHLRRDFRQIFKGSVE